MHKLGLDEKVRELIENKPLDDRCKLFTEILIEQIRSKINNILSSSNTNDQIDFDLDFDFDSSSNKLTIKLMPKVNLIKTNIVI